MLSLGPLPVEPPVVLAPMAGITNAPFRTLCREQGAGLFVSEMITARALVERDEKTMRLIRFAPEEKPRSLQLYGVDPAVVGDAVRMVVDHLLGCEAIGAVTTHDLELARDPEFTARADSFHLQETITGEGPSIAMTFDYRLRPGPAQAGNALQLLRMLGLAR